MCSYLPPKQCTSAENTLLTINSMQKKLIPIDKISDNNELPRLWIYSITMKDGHHFLFPKSKSISHRDISISKPCELIHIPTIEIEVGLLIYTDHWTASIWFAMLSSGFDVVVTDSSSTGFRGTLALMRSWKKAPSLSPPPKISTSSCSWFSW